MHRNSIHFVLLIFLTTLTNDIDAQDLRSLDWLIGDWSSNQSEILLTESWSKENDSTFVGNSRITNNGIEQFSESLSIELRNNTIRYIAILPSKTAIFPLHQMDESSIRFLDPQNDFPSEIEYQKTDLGLDVILTGNQPKQPHREVLHFKKKR